MRLVRSYVLLIVLAIFYCAIAYGLLVGGVALVIFATVVGDNTEFVWGVILLGSLAYFKNFHGLGGAGAILLLTGLVTHDGRAGGVAAFVLVCYVVYIALRLPPWSFIIKREAWRSGTLDRVRDRLSRASDEASSAWEAAVAAWQQRTFERAASRRRSASRREQQRVELDLTQRAGRQKVIGYLGDIRRAIDSIEPGIDNRQPLEMVHGYIDSILADDSITAQHKATVDVQADVRMLQERLKELGFGRDDVVARLKRTFRG